VNPVRARQLGDRPVALDRRQRHLGLEPRPMLLACLLHVLLPRHRRFLGAGLHLTNQLSRFRGPPQTARGHTYLYLVEGEREGRPRPPTHHPRARPQGRAAGELERLVASLVRHCYRAIILSDMEAGRIACTRIGGPLLFGRLWERLGIPEVLGRLLTDRGFEVTVERAVFASVLHRLFVSGSDRSCEKWMADYRIAGIDELQLHHFYRRWPGGARRSPPPGPTR